MQAIPIQVSHNKGGGNACFIRTWTSASKIVSRLISLSINFRFKKKKD